eukprot:23179_1
MQSEHDALLDSLNTIVCNGDFLYNPSNGRTNCLDSVVRSTLDLFFEKKPPTRNFVDIEEVDARQVFINSDQDLLSQYIDCHSNGTLKLDRTTRIKKRNFQINLSVSELSQANNHNEAVSLKGFGAEYDSQFDFIDFVLSHNIKYSNHDDICAGWLNLSMADDVDHIIIFLFVGYLTVFFDPQLSVRNGKKVAFKSINALSNYRSLNMIRREGDRVFREVAIADHLLRVYLYPFAPTMTIINYPVRRMTAPIWPYSNGRLIGDKLRQFHSEKHPDCCFEDWCRRSPNNVSSYIQLIDDLFGVILHPFLSYLRDLLRSFHPLNVAQNVLPPSVDLLFGSIQIAYKRNTSYACDLHIYRNVHNDEEYKSNALDAVQDATQQFRLNCQAKWQELRASKAHIDPKRYNKTKWILLDLAKMIHIVDNNDVEYIASAHSSDPFGCDGF